MAASLQFLVFSLLFLFLNSFSDARRSFRPNGLVVLVTKDASTLQYVTRINQRTPLVPINVVIHLGAQFLWVDCNSGYMSSSYYPSHCQSTQCQLANAEKRCSNCSSTPRPGCNNKSCVLFPENVFAGTISAGDLGEDILTLPSTNGLNPGPIASVPHFLFSCAQTFLLEGLANGVQGIAGLGWNRIALPVQLASAFNFRRKFAICLPPSTTSTGVIFFGDGPYVLLPNIDVSKILIYTPLIINPISTARVSHTGEPSYEYFIGVKFIKINGKKLSLNSSLLSINNEGVGGTKISTVDPYTVLESSIYKAFTKAYVNKLRTSNITRVSSVAPFSVCFSSENINGMRIMPAMPVIDLVLQSDEVFWRIFETNAIVRVSDDVFCLAFVDGGLNPRTSIVIGGYQLEDNLLQFDLVDSRLGFSSSLLLRQTSCVNFNSTPTA